MALNAVELYERLKPQLGGDETKALIEYVDEKIHGEVARKEDLLVLKGELRDEIQAVRDEIQAVRAEIQKVREEVREEIWKLRVLVIVVLVAVVALNPKVLELAGRVLGVGR
jgi:ATP/maltotriose-dependent transcriptional regulator MalT